MSGSRESSPEWLRSFKVPTDSPLTLSSDSGSLQDGSTSVKYKSDHEESSPKSPRLPKTNKSKGTCLGKSCAESLKPEEKRPTRRKKLDSQKKIEGDKGKRKVVSEATANIDKDLKHNESIHSVWTLSSDSESYHAHSPTREETINQVEISGHQKPEFPDEDCEDAIVPGSVGKSPSKRAPKEKSSEQQLDIDDNELPKGKKIIGSMKRKGNAGGMEVKEEETTEKHVESKVSSSALPLLLSEKVHRTKALVECEGDSIDLSGDIGAVGRVIISDTPSGDQEMYLDLKGTIYKTSIVPSRTFCIVSLGQSEAKVEAIMNDFVQLKPQSNVYEAETMVEGTLDGFSFDSDEEANKIPKATSNQTDENELVDEQSNGKAKRKADKISGVAKKRGRSTSGKPQPQKKIRKKTQGSKKAKTKK
ncbi:hypothetical protein L6164_029857 [Bauhinia variegata]|uniref:Uncharacterized protein n=1 Tax=Bauhinia variegata TaxID=167791 RepID=A0ACB9LA14_BAUVA|nr:hypothetical protein L6164_029857 [Bauhinia variegata]